MTIPGTHPAAATDAGPLFKVIEVDTMTGWRQYLNNMSTSPWTGTFTREQAEASVEALASALGVTSLGGGNHG